MTLTPFLALVIAGYAVFMVSLGLVWGRSYAEWVRTRRNQPK